METLVHIHVDDYSLQLIIYLGVKIYFLIINLTIKILLVINKATYLRNLENHLLEKFKLIKGKLCTLVYKLPKHFELQKLYYTKSLPQRCFKMTD